MYAYGKSQSYRETKMRLLHRLEWIDRLSQAYDNGNKKERQWFKGYHVYKSKEEVIERFEKRKLLSCFCKKNEGSTVQVAFQVAGQNRRWGDDNVVHYLRIQYDTASNAYHDTGVHFCTFGQKTEVGTANKIDLQPGNDVRYALMLPLLTDREDELLPRYTLVYDDWGVLTVANVDVWKGRVRVDLSVHRG